MTNNPQQFEFLRQISNDTNNLVIGIVRDKPTTEKRVAGELGGRSNIHILQADVTDYDALKVSEVKLPKEKHEMPTHVTRELLRRPARSPAGPLTTSLPMQATSPSGMVTTPSMFC